LGPVSRQYSAYTVSGTPVIRHPKESHPEGATCHDHGGYTAGSCGIKDLVMNDSATGNFTDLSGCCLMADTLDKPNNTTRALTEVELDWNSGHS